MNFHHSSYRAAAITAIAAIDTINNNYSITCYLFKINRSELHYERWYKKLSN